MNKKAIQISEEVYKKLVEIKKGSLERWNEKLSFDDVIKGLIQDAEYYMDELENKHCLNCCDCDDCVNQRKDWKEQEAQVKLEKDWD